MKARKPANFTERGIADYKLWSIVTARRCRSVRDIDITIFNLRYPLQKFLAGLIPERVKDFLRRTFA
jgi:hypothetical protein